ncbi:transposase [Salmonella enterica subsp. salamae]|uniref:Transposase n=1 Tax=Salmonella enterica TaxID=28901 RepID=A0A379SDU7_SALER|nr:transposase [Salmonella enterica]SUJ07944.1 transposase [Salmonella enterica subsp. salamae]
MKYVFIEKHQAEFSIKAMCRVLQVARSGWCIWHQCYQRCESDPYPTPEIRSRG